MRSSTLVACAFACSSAVAASTATAAPPGAPPPAADASPPAKHERAFALTVSGGMSLGAHQGGVLYYITQLVRKNPDLYDLKALTGASAGSINSLLMALELCRPEHADPRESFFFKTWIGIGLKQLFVPKDTTPTGLFSRRAFDAPVAALERAWNDGLDARCDLVLGVSATRLAPRPLEVRQNALVLPRVEERFVVRVRGQGPGRPPRVTHFVDPASQGKVALLPIDGDDAKPFAAIRDLLFASSAFPLAFPPVPLAHCLWDRSQGAPRCTPGGAHEDDFIDGGVFDNQPLGLAVRITSEGLDRRPDGALVWRDSPDASRASLPDEFVLGYVDPDSRVYPQRTLEEQAAPKTAFGMLVDFLTTFVQAARTKGLVSTFTDHPELSRHLVVAQGNMPLMSEPLGKFFGFFEEDFRRFDFYAGMYDAAMAASASPLILRGEALRGRRPPLPEDGSEGLGGAPPAAGWAPFHCMRAVMDRTGGAERLCAGDDLASFRILLQVTLARLQSHCRTLAAEHVTPPPPGLCADAMAGAPLVRVPFLPLVAEERLLRGKDEEEVDYILRVLALYKFHFRDLGLSPNQADQAPYALRFALGDAMERFVEVQPEGAPVLEVASRALNILRYVPPRQIFYATLGDALEVGYSVTNPRASWRWLRPAAALATDGFLNWSSTGQTYFGVTPYLGLEMEPVGWNGAVGQLRFGARAGYMFSSQDKLSTGSCNTSDPRPCSRFLLEGYVSLSLFELALVRLGAFVSPALREGEGVYWGVRPAVGIQWTR